MKKIQKLKQLIQELNEVIEADSPTIEDEVEKLVEEFKNDARQDSSYRDDVKNREQWIKDRAESFDPKDEVEAAALLGKAFDHEGFGDPNHIWCNDCDDEGIIEHSVDRWIWSKRGEGSHTTDDSQSFCDCAVGRKLEDQSSDY